LSRSAEYCGSIGRGSTPWSRNRLLTRLVKYDVRYSNGKAGTGGEYNVQEGFGWTNAVVLNLINRYNSSLTVRTSGKAKSCEINFALLSSLLIFVIDI